jgi:excisionase family DNA binding protein
MDMDNETLDSTFLYMGVHKLLVEHGLYKTDEKMRAKAYSAMQESKEMDEVYYKPQEVADILKLHLQTILNYIHKGKLNAINLSKGKTVGGYRITRTDLRKFIDEK